MNHSLNGKPTQTSGLAGSANRERPNHSRASEDPNFGESVQPLTMTSQRAGIPATPREDDL